MHQDGAKLHATVCTLILLNEAEICRAVEILHVIKPRIAQYAIYLHTTYTLTSSSK